MAETVMPEVVIVCVCVCVWLRVHTACMCIRPSIPITDPKSRFPALLFPLLSVCVLQMLFPLVCLSKHEFFFHSPQRDKVKESCFSPSLHFVFLFCFIDAVLFPLKQVGPLFFIFERLLPYTQDTRFFFFLLYM